MSRAGRKGSRKQSPPRPDDIAWHCSMVSKLQEVTAEVTSLRQYSPALAGVAKATNPRANNAVAGAAVILENCFISFSLFFQCQCCGRPFSLASPRWDVVLRRATCAWLMRSHACYLLSNRFDPKRVV